GRSGRRRWDPARRRDLAVRRRAKPVPHGARCDRPPALARPGPAQRDLRPLVGTPRPAAPPSRRHPSGGPGLTMPTVWIPATTAILALVFALALLDQWRERRQGFQLIWAAGMLFYGVAAGCEALGAAGGWNEALYRTWYLTGAMWTAGWLGLGTTFLLSRTRFGYTFAVCLLL